MPKVSYLKAEGRDWIVLPEEIAQQAQVQWLPPEDVRTYGTALLVPHTTPMASHLSYRGIPVEGRINHDYPYPGRFVPYDHQRVTSDFFTRFRRAYCANGIGTCKTLSALWAMDYLRQLGIIKRTLIVTTISTLDVIWQRELFMTFPYLKANVLYGDKARRQRLLDLPADVYIINHDGLKTMCDFTETYDDKLVIGASLFDDRPDINHVIVDECAIYRNSAPDNYMAIEHVAGPRSGVPRGLWMMSGSPMPKAPTDVWAQGRLMDHRNVPRYFSRFRDRVMRKVSEFKWVNKPGWEQTAFTALQPCIRFKREDCTDLPPCIVERRQVTLSPEQKKLYSQLKNQARVEMEEGALTALNEGVKRTKFLQIASGIVYLDGRTEKELNTANRKKVMLEVIEESGSKIIIFTPYTHCLRMVQRMINAAGYSVGVVYGDVGKSARTEIFHNFQYGDLQVLLAHPQTMAHGLDLTASHTVLWWAPLDNWEIVDQANGRITRPGQDVKQTIVYLEGSPVEIGINNRNEAKESTQGLLLSLLEEGKL